MNGLSLSANAHRIALLLNEQSEVGMTHDPILPLDKIIESLQLTKDLAEEALDELKDEGFVGVILTINASPRVFPHNLLFWETDPILRGWKPAEDARRLSSLLINSKQDGANIPTLDNQLGWGPRRINPSVTYLVDHELVMASKAIGTHPYACAWIKATTKTRRFLRND